MSGNDRIDAVCKVEVGGGEAVSCVVRGDGRPQVVDAQIEIRVVLCPRAVLWLAFGAGIGPRRPSDAET